MNRLFANSVNSGYDWEVMISATEAELSRLAAFLISESMYFEVLPAGGDEWLITVRQDRFPTLSRWLAEEQGA